MPTNDELDNITLNDTVFLNSNLNDDGNNDLNYLQINVISDKNSNKNKFENNKDLTNKSKSQSDKTIINLDTNLSTWGIPDSVLIKYKEKGISNMFMWQVECLSNKKVLENNNNLIYSAPTSAGKTLVAEILALKTLLERQKKVIMILPFVSVVREKMFYFQDILSLSGIRVEGFMGSHSPPGGFKAVQFAICTIEKANSIVNKLLEDKTLNDVGAVIIDEMHLLGDPSRGYLLELLLTKLRYMSSQNEDISIQLIGMSATLPNLDLLAKWLNAELYTTTFRPIPLQEFYLFSGEIFNTEFQSLRRLEPSPDLTEDSDNILQLCLETISNSCSVLIFCPTKNWCENLAQQISMAFWKLGRSKSNFGKCLREQLDGNTIAEVLEQLKRCPVGLDGLLKKTVSFGVAFHHAGLTMDERDIIEGAFRTSVLRVLIATSTLSSGVNLPAQRVIIRTPMFHGKPLDSLTYRQMIGRAGRMGKDTSGESILVCQKTDKRIAGELMSAKLHAIESCLEGAGKLKRAILEVIASGVATTPEEVNLFTNCTLLAASVDENLGVDNPIEKSVEFLITNEFIRLQKDKEGELKYVPTCLAKACLSSSLPPEDGLALFEEIEKARQCFVLDSDLHLLYLVTPYSVCSQWTNLDWMLYLDFWEKLSPSMKRVADLVGVQESFIFNATRGKINTSTSKQYHRLQIHRRFYTALALQDLVKEIPLNEVADKFQCSRGMLQSLQQSASMFAGMVTSFCSQLGWKCVEILVSQFQDRLQFGIHHELLDLMKLPNLNGPRARALYNAGIETMADLASFDVCKLENILLSSVPFESEKEREGETAYDVEQKKKIRGIFITGKQGLTAREAADMLIRDARKYLQLEIGAAVLKWDITESSKARSQSNTDSSSSTSSSCSTNNLTAESDTNKNIEIKDEINNGKDNCAEALKSKTEDIISCENENGLQFNEIISTSTENNKIIDHHTNNSTTLSKILNNDTSVNFNISEIESEREERNEDNKKEKSGHSIILSRTKNANSVFCKTDRDINNGKINNNINNSSIFIEFSNTNNNKMDKNLNISEIDFEQEINNDDIKENICDEDFDCNWTSIDCEIPSFSVNISRSSEKFNRRSVNDLNKSDSSMYNRSGSLFEESITLDSNLCDALDIPSRKSFKNQEVTMEDTSFFDNIPNSFNIEEPIKTPENINEISNSDENVFDVIDTSQSDTQNCTVNSLYNSVKKSKKYIETPRKRGRNTDREFSPNNLYNTPKKKQKIDFQDENSCSISPKNFTAINIVDVCKDKTLFDTFCQEIKAQSKISIAVACEYKKQKRPLIGQNIINSPNMRTKNTPNINEICDEDRLITGVAISCGSNSTYFMSFLNVDIVKNDEKVCFLENLLQNPNLIVRIFEFKEHAKVLYKSCKIIIKSTVEDPKILDWLHDPEGKEKSLSAMTSKYIPELLKICYLAGNSKRSGSSALDLNIAILSRLRASVEALVTWHLVESQKNNLIKQNVKLLETFETEMKSILCLAQMEIAGICVDKNKMNKLISIIQEQLNTFQQQAFSLAGRHFSFTSSKEVAKVLGMYNGKKISTNKQTLEQNENPISKLILQWRKLNCTLTKMMFPILRSLKEDKIHGCCVIHSATGRISMHEPNLQNVPRNYDIIKLDKTIISLSVRSSFIPEKGKVFLSADYCQLELRLLAHLSQDKILCNIMKSKEDVFKSIAAKLNKILEDQVTDEFRQRAKQLCYGIIYGMGSKALSEQLNSTEEEALEFTIKFKSTYPKIQQFINQTIQKCKEKGFVETLAGRRRYLPNINHDNPALKSQAERQAVNTTIQGSAADIAKKAMVSIDNHLKKYFANEKKVFLVLHLHDELLYEVPVSDFKTVAKIVKDNMENSVQLSIPFPVKLKTGLSWGELEELSLDL